MTSNGGQSIAPLSDLNLRFCIVGNELKQNEMFMKSIKHFKLPVVFNSKELINQEAQFTTIYVFNEFEGDFFTRLLNAGERILGPTTIIQYANKTKPLPNNIRPLYTTSMQNLVISFSGFRVKEELKGMVFLVHHMGGSIRRDFNVAKTTHLVATPAKSDEKYRYAVSMGIPVMTSEWIYQTWSRRHDVNCCATDDELMQYKLLPFVGCKLAFLGYQKEEEEHMIEISLKNGGEIVESENPSCTHIIVEDGYVVNTSAYDRELFIVKKEWFWACIQMEAKTEEGLYIYENPNATLTSSSNIMPVRGNKRKRLESVARQLARESIQENEIFCPDPRRKSEVAKLSISGSFLDATMSPDRPSDISSSHKDLESTLKSPAVEVHCLSPRQQVCFELFQTESNYVGILHTIITVFKEPLENPEQVGGVLLAPAEIKIIFGNLPPIYEIHQKIRNELSEIIYSWSEDHSIGNLILKHAHELMKSYPPFINFFEKTKSLLVTCDASKPRFHAFLKRCQSKPECGRQTLQELLIRPVQRLPSVILLLNDILKHTPKSSPDNQALEKAIQALKDVLLHINEDKRKTEGQVEMFDIVNDIENCPPNLLSSHRSLVCKVDCQEVTDLLNKKCPLTMFLFTDVLEISKKRVKSTANLVKSPSTQTLPSSSSKAHSKSYKHLDLIPLSHIKRVVDVVETEDCKNVFAIVVWCSKQMKELLYAFVLLDETDKNAFLRTLSRQVANTVCKADADILLTTLEPEQLDLHEYEIQSGNVLTKALNKTRSKLGRALSMKKTPTKRGLNRAVSTIISPLRNFGTPANSMGTWRLSSVTNLTQFPYILSEVLLPIHNELLKSSGGNNESKARSLSPQPPPVTPLR